MARTTGRRLGWALLAAAVVLGVVGWIFRGELRRLLPGGGEPVEVSEETAALAEAKLGDLRPDGDAVRLSSVEVTSLLRFRAPLWTTEQVHEPEVAFGGDTIRLAGTIATDRLPSHPDLDRVRVILPDSSRLEVVGRLEPLGPGRVALEVARVQFAGIPIPARYYPAVLRQLGRRDEPGLGPGALAIPLPPAVAGARVEEGTLILTPPTE